MSFFNLFSCHKYLERVSSEILGDLALCDYDNEEANSLVYKKFRSFFEVMKGHAGWEESFVFSHLPKKKIEEEFQCHKILEVEMEELEQSLKQMKPSPEAFHQVYLRYRKFHFELLRHLYDEEVEILPALRQKLGEEGLRRIDFDIYKGMSSEDMVAMAKDLFPPCSFLEKKATLEDLCVANQKSLRGALPSLKTHFAEHEWPQILELFS